MICPVCGFNAPEGCLTCWKCGACLDRHIKELSGRKKK